MSSLSCEPIATCTYGWCKRARFYQDVVVLHGRLYELAELEEVRARYHRFLGIASARLILRFRSKTQVLRGIPEVATARQMEAYLDTYVRERQFQAQIVAENAPIVDAVPAVQHEEMLPLPEIAVPFWEYDPTQAKVEASALTEEQEALAPDALTEELPLRVPETPATEPSRWKRQRELQERRRQRLRRLREERVVREHGFDVQALALRLRTEQLPVVDVSTDLLPGEVAHYRTEAILCGEPLPGSSGRNRNRYRCKDQGLLVLTNQRVLYLGRQRQITLSHERLYEITRTRRTISFLANSWSRCQLFEVRRPLEVTMYLECILQRYARPVPGSTEQVPLRIIPTTPLATWPQGQEPGSMNYSTGIFADR